SALRGFYLVVVFPWLEDDKRYYAWAVVFFFFSSRRRHTRFSRDWSSDVCSSDLPETQPILFRLRSDLVRAVLACFDGTLGDEPRSEERRVGKECRARWAADHYKKHEMELRGQRPEDQQPRARRPERREERIARTR